jgi:lipoprotein-anchoring transpeptidase ErfK/SrfK
VGAVVDYRGPIIKNGGCEEGWVRVNPRGFVCVGKGATLDLATPILAQASVRPKRGDGHPYLYALAGDEPPHFFFQLPSTAQARRVEGRDPVSRFEQWRLLKVASNPQVAALIGTPETDVTFLDGQGRLIKPYGVLHRLEEKVHSGRAAADSGFAIARVIEHEKRWYGMTTEHDFVALDRLRIAVPSSLRGIEIPSDASLPVGIVNREQLAKFERNASSNLAAVGALPKRQGVLLTGKSLAGGMMETRDGHWVAAEGLTIIPARKEYPSFATGDRKWLDLSILRQTLVAYVGQKPVYATLISSGRGGMGDPETEFATPRGTFMVYAKHVSATMDGEDDATDSYSLLDVPFVQYFHKGFALHGTYWHDEFGKLRSHGCVNLSARDAAWLFEWTDPQVFSDWHGVINKERGTVVHIHG